jgi:hypothetical protein
MGNIQSTDILRIHAFWQFYRYEMDIARIFRIDIYRFVGDIANFEWSDLLKLNKIKHLSPYTYGSQPSES